jgi:hypothetical protein
MIVRVDFQVHSKVYDGPMRRLILTGLAMPMLATALTAQTAPQHPPMPPGTTHEQHQRQMEKDAEVKKRGAAAMGFDQAATIHHFRLTENGGTIEVTVNNPDDTAGLEQVRSHLREIAAAFAAGDFAKPLAIHGELPPGVAAMQEHKDRIGYLYEDLPTGGRVRITTTDTATRSAIHDFLRYQIREHATGDALTVTS